MLLNIILKEGTLGRKLEFITQEINREVNTISSKSIDYPVSQSVIELKSTFEKVREQIQLKKDRRKFSVEKVP